VYIKEIFKHWTYQVFSPGSLLRYRYDAFRNLLKYDTIALELIAELEEISYCREKVDYARVVWLTRKLAIAVKNLIDQLMIMSPTRYLGMLEYFRKVEFYINLGLDLPEPEMTPPFVVSLDNAMEYLGRTGGKAENLSRVAPHLDLDIPQGFAVTTNAFNYFLESNQLRSELEKRLRRMTLSKPQEIAKLCSEIRTLLMQGDIPEEMGEHIERAARILAPATGLLAVRSSATAEDSFLSFAGQYDTLINVPFQDVLSGYKQIIASKYGYRAVVYRIRNGLSDYETPMAVLFMPMIESKVSGVVHTLDMEHCARKEGGALAVFAVAGQGEGLVSGRATGQRVCLTRTEEPEIIGGHQENLLLDREAVVQLARSGLQAEMFFEVPQDLEWVLDCNDKLFILQCRRLDTRQFQSTESEVVPVITGRELASGLRLVSPGVASGPVFRVSGPDEIDSIPRGAVVLASTLDPELSRVVDSVAALVSDAGSRASHFGQIAREWGLPVLSGLDDAGGLVQGQVVTVHADQGRIYEGPVELGLRGSTEDNCMGMSRTLVGQRLKRIMPHITVLHLTDPRSPDFAPEGCKSMHDFVRFCHEKGVSEMFTLVGKGSRAMARAKRLETGLPMTMYVLDLGSGLFDSAKEQDVITPDDIKSSPMTALWWGLSSREAVWDENLRHADWEEFDRISSGIFSLDSHLLASYALLAGDYVHLMVRFGYHFSIVDALSGKIPEQNYINFRFKGGGGTMDQRLNRLRFISGVLSNFGFKISRKGDLLDARIKGYKEGENQKRLAVLGLLMAKTRLMDIRLDEESQADDEVAAFLETVRLLNE
jgi:pyruvate, water dikinase